ncbi:hypothetical protein LABF186_15460 [Lactobacillus amylovorus subsp. animalium]|uniref:Uncharacterized protein n=1 Tax=Lactobacillus amylovorus subsp. animalium TaxID=3378536 RepID=A0ABD0C576_LACAM|nr:hypothetical protein LABF186_15460 [Lactobacillus amylovorus]GMM16405.1 hypothetical protein LABF125_15390 [Lactobacillus amylovorus]
MRSNTAFARTFLDESPESILTTVKFFDTGVDEQSGIIMKNTKDQMVVMALVPETTKARCCFRDQRLR